VRRAEPATLDGVDTTNRRDEVAVMAAEPRFLTLADVAEVLNISTSQVYALVRNEELAAIKIGGRGQWRVERDRLEDYIVRMYKQTSEFIAEHPFVDTESGDS
jgi:excisionase family DNA binding protein